MEDFVKNDLSKITENVETEIEGNSNNEGSLTSTRSNYVNTIKKKSNDLQRGYDINYKPNKEEIAKFPDLQNGPSSLIQGSNVEIQQVGIHNFRLPLKFRTRDNGSIELETKVTGTVSLEAHKKGINMSRIMRSFYGYKNETFSIDKLEDVLTSYQSDLKSFDSKINLRFSYPIMRKSLRSDNSGYQYYNVSLQGNLDKQGVMKKIIHFDFVYSSACPCSYELSRDTITDHE